MGSELAVVIPMRPAPEPAGDPASDAAFPSATAQSAEAPVETADAGFDAWFWRPSVSAPFVRRSIELRSVFAQKTFRTLFGRLQMSAYGMSVTIPILERDQGQTGDVLERQFIAALERVLAMQARTRDRCRHWLGNVVGAPPVHYVAQTQVVDVFTPGANHALDVFTGLDETITMIDELWYAGIVSASQAKRAILEARAQVKNFVNEMDGLCRRSKASIRRTQAGAAESGRSVAADDSAEVVAGQPDEPAIDRL